MTKKRKIFGTLDPFMEFGDVLGRKVANTTFLSALLAADPFEEYHFYLSGKRECEDFSRNIRMAFPDRADRVRAMVRSELPQGLAAHPYHVFHLSDCITHQPRLARVRNAYSPKPFPITGVTHSLSYAHYGPALLAHLSPTTTSRDCIVSTSRTGVGVVEKMLTDLRSEYGLSEASHPGPSIRRVPLGVDTSAITPAGESDQEAARKRLGLDKDRRVLLVFGRLSHYSKMDLLPLLRALDRAKGMGAAGMDPATYTLVLAGWIEDGETYHEAVTELAGTLGIDVRVVARPDEAQKLDLFHAADLFVSIADNPQETFGITIIEAMAAGLPVVASRYDGYRDLVQDGQTGLLVDTLAPDSTETIDALAPLLFDSDSHLLLAQQTAVEVPALAEALARLHLDGELRRTMGEAGRKRSLRYDWTRVMEEYLTLWDALWTVPANGKDTAHPMEMRYGRWFGQYAQSLAEDAKLSMSAYGEQVYRGRALPVIYPGVGHEVDLEMLKKLLFAARKQATTKNLHGRLMGMGASSSSARFLVLWALKHDLLERAS